MESINQIYQEKSSICITFYLLQRLLRRMNLFFIRSISEIEGGVCSTILVVKKRSIFLHDSVCVKGDYAIFAGVVKDFRCFCEIDKR